MGYAAWKDEVAVLVTPRPCVPSRCPAVFTNTSFLPMRNRGIRGQKKPSIPNRQPSLTLCLSRQINGEPFWAPAFTCSEFQSSFIHTLPWTHLFVSNVCPMALVKSTPLYSVLREDGQCPPFPIFLRWQGFLHHGVWG